jgi:hypothetical protein
MIALSSMLKAFGVNVTEQDIKTVEQIIPSIPEKLQQAVLIINSVVNTVNEQTAAIKGQSERLATIESYMLHLQQTQLVIGDLLRRLLEEKECQTNLSKM